MVAELPDGPWSIGFGDIIQIDPRFSKPQLAGKLLTAIEIESDSVLGYIVEDDGIHWYRVQRTIVSITGGQAVWNVLEFLEQQRLELIMRLEALRIARSLPGAKECPT